jgi:hypothetical protein
LPVRSRSVRPFCGSGCRRNRKPLRNYQRRAPRSRESVPRNMSRVTPLIGHREQLGSERGKAKNHRLLCYVREHPEELRPIVRHSGQILPVKSRGHRPPQPIGPASRRPNFIPVTKGVPRRRNALTSTVVYVSG